MRKKVKKALKEVATLLGFSFLVGLLLCKPYIKEFFKKDYYIVIDNVSAQQEIAQSETENIEVEFRCPEWEFKKLLTNFKNAHKGMIEIDTTIEDETPYFDDDSTKSFIVTFFRSKE